MEEVDTNSNFISRRARMLLSGWITIYFSVTLAHKFFESSTPLVQIFGVSNTVTQTMLDLLILVAALRIPYEIFRSRLNKYLFLSAFLFGAIADSTYGTWVNILGLSNTRGTWRELVYNIPFCLFLVTGAAFSFGVIFDKIRSAFGKLFTGAVSISIILVASYFVTTDLSETSLQTCIFTVVSLVSEAILIVSGGILFLFGRSIPIQLISGGFLAICSVNLLLQYLEFSGTLTQGVPFEAFWVLGQISIFLGVVGIHNTHLSSRIFDFSFKNIRARFVLSFVLLITALHICWQIFFTTSDNFKLSIINIFLFLIFLSLAFTPVTFLFKSLFIEPVLNLLEQIYTLRKLGNDFSDVDADLRKAGDRVVNKILNAERAEFESQAMEKVTKQVAHDIQSPLATLLKLTKDPHTFNPCEQQKFISLAAERLEEMTKDLVSQSLGKRFSQVHSSSKIGPIIESVIAEKKAEIGKSLSGYLKFKIPEDLRSCVIPIRESELVRVLSNLLNNSVRAISNQSSPTIEISLAQAADPDFLIVKIEDSGVGISPETLHKIRTIGGSYNNPSGSGLGLTFAKQVMEKCRGRFSIDSTLAMGTVVRLEIPIVRSALSSTNGYNKNPDLVLIDDDDNIRSLWSLEAKAKGLSIWQASDETGIPLDQISKHTAIFVDRNLADGKSGIEVCQRLHDLGFTRLFLATGDRDFPIPPFVLGIVGKEFPKESPR